MDQKTRRLRFVDSQVPKADCRTWDTLNLNLKMRSAWR